MYPATELLEEIGRITVAGSRLDVQMGFLWWHLDPAAVDRQQARRAAGAKQASEIRKLASRRLNGQLEADVLTAVADADSARERRNDVVHQDWLLRGREGMRSVAEIAAVEPDDMPGYVEEWEREALASPDWQRIPPHTLDLEPAHPLETLKAVERALVAATSAVQAMAFRVASARETGSPPGYVH